MRHILAGWVYLVVLVLVSPAASVRLSWQDNSDNEDGFRVERALGATGAFLEIAGSVPGNSTGYVDTATVDGATYRYRVRAYNTAGDSEYSNVATVTLPPLVTVPVAPGAAQAVTSGRLVNLSNRGLIEVGQGSMIPGFTVQGGPVRVLVRVIGPTLANFGLTGTSDDPRLSLRNQSAPTVEIGANDNWLAADGPVMAQVGAFALPAGSNDAALVITLQPGQYTIVTSGGAGVALAEIYAVP